MFLNIGNLFIFNFKADETIYIQMHPLFFADSCSNGSFVWADPFRLFKTYANYSEEMFVIPNRDFISSTVYLKNARIRSYNSFIFGSSRTVAYKTETWSKFLKGPSNPFVFDASGESLFGIYTKMKYIDSHGGRLKNVLLIIDTDCTFAHEGDQEGHLSIKHPTIAKTSWIRFYWTFFKSYLDRPFFKSYWKFRLKGKYDESMADYIENRHIQYDAYTNDVRLMDQDKALENDTASYYASRAHLFYDRPNSLRYAPVQLTEKYIQMLDSLRQILNRQHTNYKIIISPLYDQVKMNASDLTVLKRYFPGHVYDFSGKNSWTNDRHNYYESSHYTPRVGEQLLNLVY